MGNQQSQNDIVDANDTNYSVGADTSEPLATQVDAMVERWQNVEDVSAPTPLDPLPVPKPWNERHIAIGIGNVLSNDQCKELISLSEGAGYKPALLNVGRGRQIYAPEVRKSDRFMIDSPKLAKYVWDRIKSVTTLPDRSGMSAAEINERLRFLRYDKGGNFQIHCDGKYTRPGGTASSFMTLLLYLNSDYTGCRTRLYSTDEEKTYDFPPSPGTVLIHDHRVNHAATELVSGRKYVIRSDIMYTHTSPAV